MAREQMLIGLYSPAPQSGKSTVADFLVERFGFTRKGFARALKDMTLALLEAFGFAPKDANDYVYGSRKETPIPEMGGRSSRYLQQTLGTEWGRELVAGDLWIKAVLNDRRPDLLVVDDLRFPNEYDAIRAEGGQVWKVVRPGAERTNTHPSEGLLDDREFDEVIVNDGSIRDLEIKTSRALIGP